MEPLYTLPEPFLEFKDIEFKAHVAPNYSDTVVVRFILKDGDKDFGLDQVAQPQAPYNQYNAILKSTRQPVDFLKVQVTVPITDVLTFKDRKTPPNDTLPKFQTCFRWVTPEDKPGLKDTVYIQQNLYYTNLIVDILVDDGSGTFSHFDLLKHFGYPGCFNSFSGRILPINFTGSFKSGPFTFKPISATSAGVEYRMASVGWIQTFGGKKIKIRIKGFDRALHESNTIETTALQL